MIAAKLDAAIKSVCPIHGVSIGRKDDKSTWMVHFKDEATQSQRDAAMSAVAAFDVQAQLAQEEKDKANEPILRELEENDRKIIRAITENDLVRIDAHKKKQAALRAKLK